MIDVVQDVLLIYLSIRRIPLAPLGGYMLKKRELGPKIEYVRPQSSSGQDILAIQSVEADKVSR